MTGRRRHRRHRLPCGLAPGSRDPPSRRPRRGWPPRAADV